MEEADREVAPLDPSDDPDVRGQMVASSRASVFRGPLPPPAVLKEYEQLLPGATERLLTMSEQQTAHRLQMQRESMELTSVAVQASASRANRGQIFAAFIATFIILVGLVVALFENAWAGAVIISVDVAGIVGAFIRGTFVQRGSQHHRQVHRD